MLMISPWFTDSMLDDVPSAQKSTLHIHICLWWRPRICDLLYRVVKQTINRYHLESSLEIVSVLRYVDIEIDSISLSSDGLSATTGTKAGRR